MNFISERTINLSEKYVFCSDKQKCDIRPLFIQLREYINKSQSYISQNILNTIKIECIYFKTKEQIIFKIEDKIPVKIFLWIFTPLYPLIESDQR